jgi:hypothetical protein
MSLLLALVARLLVARLLVARLLLVILIMKMHFGLSQQEARTSHTSWKSYLPNIKGSLLKRPKVILAGIFNTRYGKTLKTQISRSINNAPADKLVKVLAKCLSLHHVLQSYDGLLLFSRVVLRGQLW